MMHRLIILSVFTALSALWVIAPVEASGGDADKAAIKVEYDKDGMPRCLEIPQSSSQVLLFWLKGSAYRRTVFGIRLRDFWRATGRAS